MPQPDQPPVPDAKTDAKVRFDFIARVHVYTHDYIRFADTKASAILAACGFLFTGLLTRGDAIAAAIGKSPSRTLTGLFLGVGSLTLISLALTIYHSVSCVMPRLGSRGRGLIYWDQVAQHTEGKYVEAVLNATSEEMTTELARHVHAVSGTAKSKYSHVSKALRWFCATLVFSLGASLFLIWINVMGSSH